jgi:hypothetical protein
MHTYNAISLEAEARLGYTGRPISKKIKKSTGIFFMHTHFPTGPFSLSDQYHPTPSYLFLCHLLLPLSTISLLSLPCYKAGPKFTLFTPVPEANI